MLIWRRLHRPVKRGLLLRRNLFDFDLKAVDRANQRDNAFGDGIVMEGAATRGNTSRFQHSHVEMATAMFD